MARAFDDQELKAVRKNLLDCGTEVFGRLGFTGTSLDEVTRKAGTAKGTLYKFWPSKETFFFACLEEAEQQFQEEVIEPLLMGARNPADALGRILIETFARAEEYPIIRQALDPRLIRKLTRKIPPAVLEHHAAGDRKEFAAIIDSWDPKVFNPGIPPEVFDGLFKGLLMMSLHKDVIGNDVYPEVTLTLGRILGAGLKALSDSNTAGKHKGKNN